MLFQQIDHQLPQRLILDPLLRDRHQLGKHLLGIESRHAETHLRIEAIRLVAFLHRSDLANFQLRPKIRRLQLGPQLVELANSPLIAAGHRVTGIGPDRETDLALRIPKRHAEIRFAVARRQFLLVGQERKKIGLLPFGKLAQWNNADWHE